MHLQSTLRAAFALAVLPQSIQALSQTPCPIPNAYYPAPSNLASSSHIKLAAAQSKTLLMQSLRNGSSFGRLDPNMTAFSVEVYSLHTDEPLLTYHYTPEPLASQSTEGVSLIDSNTIFRIGSVSKLWTVYLFLIAAGDGSWNQPITNFVPELAAIATDQPASEDQIDRVAWDTITIGALASQLAGIGRDAAYSAGLAAGLKSIGLADQGGNSHSTCGDAFRSKIPCNRTAFFEDFPRQHPVTNPFQTPVYSNAAYQILSYALENITGQSMENLFTESFVKPLSLNGTYYHTPTTTDSAFIPINATASWFNADALDETPAGGYYSTINDLRIVGKAILNSTLLSPAQTRRWMKPSSFTASPDFAVGAPWEILRAPGDPVSWMYTKSGDVGSYSALTGLMPDLGLGFNILAAGMEANTQVAAVADIVTAKFVPAFWSQAKDEASNIYAGAYGDKSTNSTLAVSVTSDGYGLSVDQFVLGGQNVVSLLGSMIGVNLTMRLYPMGLSQAGGNGTRTESWRALFEQDRPQVKFQPYRCISWVEVNQYVYGGVGLDEFVFSLDPNQAFSIESRIVSVGEPRLNATGRAARRMTRR